MKLQSKQRKKIYFYDFEMHPFLQHYLLHNIAIVAVQAGLQCVTYATWGCGLLTDTVLIFLSRPCIAECFLTIIITDMLGYLTTQDFKPARFLFCTPSFLNFTFTALEVKQ